MNNVVRGAALDVESVGCSLGSLRVLNGVNITMQAGQKHGIIGPNGAGKSTLFNVLTGVIRDIDGRVRLGAQDVTGRRPDRLVRSGILRTFQTPRVMNEWAVVDQVLFSAEQSGRSRSSAKQRTRRALEATSLMDVRQARCGKLSSLQRRRVALAGCLAHEPRVVLLDEPTAGLDDAETRQFADLLTAAHGEYGFTVGLVEHKLSFLMAFCDEVSVLDAGEVIAHGTPSEVSKDPKVIEAYLGTEGEPS